MPIHFSFFKGTKAGPAAGELQFECDVNTSDDDKHHRGLCNQCSAISKSTGRRCRLTSCKILGFCYLHLRQIHHLNVSESKHLPGESGLFAWNPKNDAKTPIWKKGKIIISYDGEKLTSLDIDERYDYHDEKGQLVQPTAPYALEVRNRRGAGNFVIDAACKRGAAGLANAVKGREKGARKNAKLNESGNLVATRSIFHGDEILTSYGAPYWVKHTSAFMTYSNKYKPPRKLK